MKKILSLVLITLSIFLISSCGYKKGIEIGDKIQLEKAKQRTVFVIENNDTIMNYTTSSDTIIIKLKR